MCRPHPAEITDAEHATADDLDWLDLWAALLSLELLELERIDA
jgi:hypothetical protein